MKTKSLLLIICLLCGSIVSAQKNNTMNELFNKYENEDDITIISISKAMFKMLPDNLYTNNVDIKSIMQKIEIMRILTSDNTNLKKTMNSDFKSFIDNNKNYEELMRIKDGKSNIVFNARKKGDIINELVMLIDDENNFVSILITGNFTLDDIQGITKNINVQ